MSWIRPFTRLPREAGGCSTTWTALFTVRVVGVLGAFLLPWTRRGVGAHPAELLRGPDAHGTPHVAATPADAVEVSRVDLIVEESKEEQARHSAILLSGVGSTPRLVVDTVTDLGEVCTRPPGLDRPLPLLLFSLPCTQDAGRARFVPPTLAAHRFASFVQPAPSAPPPTAGPITFRFADQPAASKLFRLMCIAADKPLLSSGAGVRKPLGCAGCSCDEPRPLSCVRVRSAVQSGHSLSNDRQELCDATCAVFQTTTHYERECEPSHGRVRPPPPRTHAHTHTYLFSLCDRILTGPVCVAVRGLGPPSTTGS